MKKYLIVFGAIALFLAAFFFFGFHHYFIDEVVEEEIEITIPEVERDGSEVVIPEEVILASGELQKIDLIHSGEGLVEIVELGEDRFIRFNDVNITNGPDLFVYVSDQAEPGNTIESLGEYTDLGALRGNMGDLVYELPDDLGHEVNSVLVWCDKFNVLFTYATME